MSDHPATDQAVTDAEATVRAYLEDAGIEWELGGRPGEFVVTLPGDKKLRTVASLLVAREVHVGLGVRRPEPGREP